MLSASGHIAGVVNPPAANKYCYWLNDNKTPADPDEWLAGAEQHDGSWWTDWDNWLKPQSGKLADARKPGDGKLKVLCDAPGTYVNMKAED